MLRLLSTGMQVATRKVWNQFAPAKFCVDKTPKQSRICDHCVRKTPKLSCILCQHIVRVTTRSYARCKIIEMYVWQRFAYGVLLAVIIEMICERPRHPC